MPERAHVTSVEALEAFRASLVIYVTKARPTLEEVSADATRTRLWLENEQRVRWEGEVRRRTRVLEDAQAALFSARVATLREETSAEQMAVHRAKRALVEAEEKLKVLKYWNREFGSRVEPLVKQLDKLQTVLTTDMVHALNYLAQAVKTLDAYAGIAAPSAASVPAPASVSPATESKDPAGVPAPAAAIPTEGGKT